MLICRFTHAYIKVQESQLLGSPLAHMGRGLMGNGLAVFHSMDNEVDHNSRKALG